MGFTLAAEAGERTNDHDGGPIPVRARGGETAARLAPDRGYAQLGSCKPRGGSGGTPRTGHRLQPGLFGGRSDLCLVLKAPN